MAETAQRRLAAIMFTDMVGYSALTQKNEALALELLEQHRELLRPIFPKHEGKEIKTIGDAFLVEFASAVRAASCAVEIQKALVQHNAAAPPDKQIHVRIGLHVGDVIFQQNDVLGDGVNIASRIEPLASPGGICVSEDVARQIRNKIELPVLKLGKGELKNIEVPVGIYRIVLPWERRRLPFSERFVFRLQQKRTRKVAVALAAVVLLSGLGWWLVRERAGLGGPVDGPIVSLAVLPLQNLMGDPEQEYFVDGMSEALIADLSKIGALKVISRTSVMQYKDARKPLREIARELGVDGIIEGSVLRADGRVRITAQLIRAATDTHLWAESYERDLQDVLRLQSEVAQAIAREIEIVVTPEEEARLASASTVNPEAYEAYLKGQFHWYKQSPQDYETALEYFQLALEKDPNYALAYTGIAAVWGGRQQHGLVPPREAGPRAKAAALKALELDSTLAEVHHRLAAVRVWTDWDWEGGEAEFRRALEINPNYAEARAVYSHLLMIMRRPEEAMAQIERALELDPFNSFFQGMYGVDLIFVRRYDDAIVQFRNALRTAPNDLLAHYVLWDALHMKRRYEEALVEAKAHYDAAGDREAGEALARGYAEAGYPGAMSLAAETLAARSKLTYVSPFDIAHLYALAGENDRTLEWLERAYEERDPNMPYLSVIPVFDPLRDDPRFQDLLRRMDLPL